MTSDPPIVRLFLPAPPLRRAVSTYYAMRVPAGRKVEDLLHPEWANMRLVLSGCFGITFLDGRHSESIGPVAKISGTLSRTAMASGEGGVLIGVGVLPSGWAQLSRLDAADFADDIRLLSDLVGDAAGALLATLDPAMDDADICARLDAWFTAHLDADADEATLMSEAHAALLDPDLASVTDWAARIDRSPRQLERLTRRCFGLPPKLLLRRQRFLRTLASIRSQPIGTWARLIDDRYADQPHFVHDFQDFMGLSPRAYFARSSPFMAAVGDARQALLGRPYHGLHGEPGES